MLSRIYISITIFTKILSKCFRFLSHFGLRSFLSFVFVLCVQLHQDLIRMMRWPAHMQIHNIRMVRWPTHMQIHNIRRMWRPTHQIHNIGITKRTTHQIHVKQRNFENKTMTRKRVKAISRKEKTENILFNVCKFLNTYYAWTILQWYITLYILKSSYNGHINVMLWINFSKIETFSENDSQYFQLN